MKIAIRTALVIGAAILLQGCVNQIKSQFRVDEALGFSNDLKEIGCKSVTDGNNSNIGGIEPINLRCYKFPAAPEGKTAYEMALHCAQDAKAGTAGTDEARKCQFYRNELQSAVMLRANAICEQHKNDIVAQAALINSGLGIAGVATAGLAAVVTGVRAKSNLAATTAFLTGSQAIVNQEFYQKQFAGTIITAINNSRASKKADIEQRRAQLAHLYTIDDALLDAQEYHYRCSFYSGVSQITKAVERQAQTSRARLIERIDALSAQADKIDKMTGISAEQKTALKASLVKQIEDVQSMLKAAVD